MSRAITLASIKNALEEIGNNDEDSNYEKPATRPCNNPFDSDIDDDTLKHSSNTRKEIRENETMQNLNIHTEKNAKLLILQILWVTFGKVIVSDLGLAY